MSRTAHLSVLLSLATLAAACTGGDDLHVSRQGDALTGSFESSEGHHVDFTSSGGGKAADVRVDGTPVVRIAATLPAGFGTRAPLASRQALAASPELRAVQELAAALGQVDPGLAGELAGASDSLMSPLGSPGTSDYVECGNRDIVYVCFWSIDNCKCLGWPYLY